jgi:hypothetical protein
VPSQQKDRLGLSRYRRISSSFPKFRDAKRPRIRDRDYLVVRYGRPNLDRVHLHSRSISRYGAQPSASLRGSLVPTSDKAPGDVFSPLVQCVDRHQVLFRTSVGSPVRLRLLANLSKDRAWIRLRQRHHSSCEESHPNRASHTKTACTREQSQETPADRHDSRLLPTPTPKTWNSGFSLASWSPLSHPMPTT